MQRHIASITMCRQSQKNGYLCNLKHVYMKKILLLAILCVTAVVHPSYADEGMWLLPLIEKLNIKDMKKLGYKLTAEHIYSINKTSMKDAIVIFGGGCTGSLISSQGLLLTNHHCGYGNILQHSTVDKDYLRDGFWAFSQGEEIPSPGLTVTFLESIADVTGRIVPELDKCATEAERSAKVSELSAQLQKEANRDAKEYNVTVQSFYGGNVYYLIVYRVYPDVRLVGAPPSSIGKFGADTDNWMWPRHTGDFALFRVYADKNGNPADYSPQNVPYKPKHYFPVSLKGVQPNDFAMILGYPGTTQRYMTSWEVSERMMINEARIKVRAIRQELMMEDMLASPKVRLQYSEKYARSSNYWKNSIGMNKALKQLKIEDLKRKEEALFTQWVNADPQRQQKYGEALALIHKAVQKRGNIRYAWTYMSECVGDLSDLPTFARRFETYYNIASKPEKTAADSLAIAQALSDLEVRASLFFKNYNTLTDEKINKAMFKVYAEDVEIENRVDLFQIIKNDYKGNTAKFVEDMFRQSFMTDSNKVKEFLKNPSATVLGNDWAFRLGMSVLRKVQEFRSEIYGEEFSKGFRLYTAGLMEMNAGKPMYPDANSTMRLTYGTVSSYAPADGVHYNYITTLKGVMEKEDPDNWEFEVPDKLKELYAKRDYGRYAAKNGTMPVNFIFNGDITGGNSGSPVLNGRGELIGCTFDGNWEAMSGDIAFEHEMQRCINVDIRYVLFIIEKYAGAMNLINEMTIR